MMSDTPKLATVTTRYKNQVFFEYEGKGMIDKATGEAEEKIRVILQEYHNSTGMIPESIGFHNVDVSTVNDNRMRIAVSNVHIKATT